MTFRRGRASERGRFGVQIRSWTSQILLFTARGCFTFPMRRSTLLIAATIGIVITFVASTTSLGTAPKFDDDGQTVARWFQDNPSHVRASIWFLTLSMMLLPLFTALIRTDLPSPHRDIFFAGGILLTGETAVQASGLRGIAAHPALLTPSTARVVLDVASYWGPVLTSATVLMLGPFAFLALRGDGELPRWLGVVTGIALIEQVVETITIFGRAGFIAPGGPMNLLLSAALTTIGLVATGVVVARRMAKSEART